MQQHPDKPWDWQGLSRNSNITWDIVQQYPDKDWNWCALSWNPMNRVPSAIKIQKCFRRYYITKNHREKYCPVMEELIHAPPGDLLRDGGISYQQALMDFSKKMIIH